MSVLAGGLENRIRRYGAQLAKITRVPTIEVEVTSPSEYFLRFPCIVVFVGIHLAPPSPMF